MSHAASAFFCSPFDDAAILTVDGVGEWATARAANGREANDRPHPRDALPPLARVCSIRAFTAFLGFEVNEGEYKVMGMAPYGAPALRGQGSAAGALGADGALLPEHGLFQLPPFDGPHTSARSSSSCSASRGRRSVVLRRGLGLPRYFGNADQLPRVAARTSTTPTSPPASRRVTEELLLEDGPRPPPRTGLKRLCMAGGVALNSVGQRSHPARDAVRGIVHPAGRRRRRRRARRGPVRLPPLLDQPRNFVLEHAYWGQRDVTAIDDAERLCSTRQKARGTSRSTTKRRCDRLVDLADPGAGRRLVPGTVRVGTAGARQPAASWPIRAAPR